MSDHIEPTYEGRRRYSRTGGYFDDRTTVSDIDLATYNKLTWDAEGNALLDGKPYAIPKKEVGEKRPCTCNYTCLRGCDGRCGCEACSLVFSIYADDRLWITAEPMRVRGWMMREFGRAFPDTRSYRAGTLHKRLRGEPKLPKRHQTHLGGVVSTDNPGSE